MKKLFLILMASGLSVMLNAQTANDLFTDKDMRVSWLGIDYSQVKLIGKFDQFGDWGEQSLAELKNDYFPAWNKVVVNEREKYDIAKMLDRKEVYYDIEMMMEHNANAKLEELEAYNEPNYTPEQIEKFVKQYKFKNKEGIGVMLLAESYNKAVEMATYHFVAINMKTGKVLFQERIKGEPGGFGLRNYWVGSVHKVLEKIEKDYYKKWKDQYASKS